MRDLRILAFDDFIVGTTTSWYTSADYNDPLGMADAIEIHGVTTNVSLPAPTLTCQIEHSANGRHWVNAGTAAEFSGSVANDTSFLGTLSLLSPVLLTFVRIRVSLSNQSNAQCRLKLHVTGRISRSAKASAPVGGGMPGRGAPPIQVSASGQAAATPGAAPGTGGG